MNSGEINLLRVYSFYLAVMFVISLLRRWEVYVDALRLLIGLGGRWPKLVRRIQEHRGLILNWTFFRPVILSLALLVVQVICSRVIWPQAVLTWSGLTAEWWWAAWVGIMLVPMLSVDLYFIIRVGRFDRAETERYFDLAETWLGWRAAAIRTLTFGYIDPSKRVDEEMRKSLSELVKTFNTAMYWVSLQMACRILVGLSLWIVWAVH